MRVLLIDDHPMMLDALSGVVGMLPGISGADRTATLAQALERIAAEPPYALHIVDMSLPDARGTEGIERLRMEKPDVPVVVFTGNDDPMMVSASIDAGARGYILKNAPAKTVLEGLEAVLRGETYVPEEMVERLMATADTLRAMRANPPRREGNADEHLASLGLSSRQVAVLRLICRGMPNKLICRELNMAEGTVKSHLNAIYQELGVHNRTQAILKVQATIGSTL